jgi:prepilin-type processing-associated H-X9-DG protein
MPDGTILIVGRQEDACCRLVDEALRERRSRVLFLPEDELLPGLQFSWRPSGKGGVGHLAFADGHVPLDSVDGVLCRSYGIVRVPDFSTPDGQYVSAEWNALLMAWLSALPCPAVINRLRPDLWYKVRLNVPDLLALAPNLCFKLPRARVTTRAEEARTFCQSIGGPVRFSPLTQPARYRIASAEDRRKLEALAGTLPLYLMEWIDGAGVEAIVVGHEVFLFDQTGALASRPTGRVHSWCVETATALGLAFCQLSLVESGAGWYCLGLDRMPQLDLTAPAAQTAIAAELATLLANTAPP